MAVKKTFEENMARLEQIVALLAAQCRKELDGAEQKVVKLMMGPDGAPIESDFLTEE